MLEHTQRCVSGDASVATSLTPTFISLLTPLYAIHQPHTLACASILLSTRLLRIPLPKDWWVLSDVDWDDIWNCAGTVMRLWDDWGLSGRRKWTDDARSDNVAGGESGDAAQWETGRKEREARWRRAWILSQGRRAVRKWVEQREAK